MKTEANIPYKFYLEESELPTAWYNVRADMKNKPAPLLNPGTLKPMTARELDGVFCDELVQQELDDTTAYIPIPDEIREYYRMYRPSPLCRAYRLEEALGTPAKIYYKFEGNNTSGSHKLNSAIAQAYYAKKQGLKGVTTETGAGQWGTALSMACSYFGLDCKVYMVKVSYEQKPFRREVMRTYGASVTPSPSMTTNVGRKILAEHPDTTGSLGCAISEAVEVATSTPGYRYVLGSVLNQVLLHQSVIGLETKTALDKLGIKPDVIIGGGSAYFLPQNVPGSKRKDNKNYVEMFQKEGYALATSNTELSNAVKGNPDKLLGLFHTGNMDGVLDRKFLKKGTVSKFPDQPDLTDSMRAALSVLSKNPEGFFLMLEAGLVDKYSHPLDWERAVYDTIMFDKVVAIAQEFCDKNPDTLLIVTGDHTHSISVIGTVDDNLPGELMRDKVGIYAEAGYPAYKDRNGDGYPDDVNVSKRLAVFIGNYPDYYETYRPKMDGPFVPSVKDEKGHYIANAAYKDVPGAQLRIGNLPRTESTGVHSIDDLVVGARGPHADAFRGFMNSTEVFRIMSEALALGNK